ncbi:AAA family ATPase [Desulforamulus hydrothermalis]|uniref:Rad50/SbcC-type AAA domain-containing protein n=1 Tax=Desulforamulus hydrothermalis Lam5 = DSM 18033 TaxID=1121428 RepID=K8DX83_9FIRM|nr:AAA family ATPase [Desulforamulus hydrothermalis]CCO07139.1 conserved hypothetical protein [Desulforamulus hydrothermalis Lam5 = DSM 18033]SHG89233.1 AAA domain-containing protein [Desulforamulus hydrothermalis Lam5 = DSM 18033]
MVVQNWHKILELRVLGGFFDGQVITFGPHLNCLVGGRGAGKTSIIELIRFALDAYPADLPARRKLEQHLTGILGNGKVRLTVETAGGQQYVVQRSLGDRAPRVSDRAGNPLALDLAGGLNFGVVIVGQSELESMAEMPAAQLALIDGKCPSFPFIKNEIRTCLNELAENRTALSGLIEECQALSERLAILPDIKERLQALAGDQLDHLLQRQRHRERERMFFDQLMRTVKQQLQQDKRRLAASQPEPVWDETAAPNQDILARALEISRETETAVRQLVSQAVVLQEKLLQQLANLMAGLAERHRAQEREDDRIQAGLPVKGLGEAVQERNRLTGLLLELERLVDRLAQKEQAQAVLLEQRQQIKHRLQQLQYNLYEQRLRVCQEYNNLLQPEIQVNLRQAGNTDKYREFLAAALSKSGMHYNRLTEQIVCRLSPGELAEILRHRDDRYLEQCCGIDKDRAQRLAGFLAAQLTPADLLALEDIWLEDLVEIRLQDGAAYKTLETLSKGQKCTAVLPLLLLEDYRPLLIDQPEDHLDNAYIFHTVVPALKKVKAGRQMIFATHNPNIPVNGEAENNLVLAADGCRGRVALQGDLSHPPVKDALNLLLEGGPEALKGRLVRYEY